MFPTAHKSGHARLLKQVSAGMRLSSTGAKAGMRAPKQVYDLRAGARMATSVAFNAGPALARFHPKFSATLLLASLGGTFTLADANGASFQRYQQVRRRE